MTRDEFIDYWMENTGLPAECRRPDGVMFPPVAQFAVGTVTRAIAVFEGQGWRALPCACADENCRGWAMVPEDTVEHHMRFYGQE